MIHIGLFYFVKEVKFLISIVLGLNMFLNKLKNLSGIKTSKLTFFEYKQTIQSYVVTFALYFLILCSQVKKLTNFASLFSPYDFEMNADIILNYFKDE